LQQQQNQQQQQLYQQLQSAESVVASVEAPPHAVKAAIAKIANTFFIFNVLSLV